MLVKGRLNMSKSLLSQLYFGKYASDDTIDSFTDYHKEIYTRYCAERTRLLNDLDAETAAGIQNLLDLHGDLTVEENARAYAAGVRFGVRLMNEALNRR